jgi:hypothetical protein
MQNVSCRCIMLCSLGILSSSHIPIVIGLVHETCMKIDVSPLPLQVHFCPSKKVK